MAIRLDNRVKQLLAKGGAAWGASLPDASEFLAKLTINTGIDFLWIDTEHRSFDHHEVRWIPLFCRMKDCMPLIRVAGLDAQLIKKALDIGASAIMVPQINNAAEARLAVQYARYPPEGTRGVSPLWATFLDVPLDDYLPAANRETLIVVQIESPDGIANLEEIAAVDGVDVVFAGPLDLSASLGVIGQTGHSKVRQFLAEFPRRVAACGKAAGITLAGYDACRQAYEQGYRFINIGNLAVQGRAGLLSDLANLRRFAAHGLGRAAPETAPAHPSPAQLGARWIVSQLRPDGSLQGGSSLADYYKGPFALTITGHIASAERMLDFVAAEYLKSDGDLDGSGVAWFDRCCIYPHAWLAMAAVMRGRFELARKLTPVILECHDDRTGGFFGTAAGRRLRRGPQEVMSTSAAALACLWAGRLDVALRAGEWLSNLWAAQPDVTRGLYIVWDSETGLVTDFPKDTAKSHFVDAGEREQWYFEYGIAAAFLASLAGASGDKRWLDLAQSFLHACESCREDVFLQPQSGKIGWGAAWTYRQTRAPEDRRLIEAVADGLRRLQSPEGWWSSLTLSGREAGKSLEPDLDVTSEFVALLGCMELELRADA